MKVWKGPELEGDAKGVQTLFVKSTFINGSDIVDVLKANQDCKRLYLGAGRTDVDKIFDIYPLFNYCTENNITMVCECSLESYKNLPGVIKEHVYIIVRIMDKLLAELSNADYIKIDTEHNVFVSKIKKMECTSLNCLEGDTFVGYDTVIYNDEDTCKSCGFITSDGVCCLDGKEKDLEQHRGSKCNLIKDYETDMEECTHE